jgi:hypothetical protein
MANQVVASNRPRAKESRNSGPAEISYLSTQAVSAFACPLVTIFVTHVSPHPKANPTPDFAVQASHHLYYSVVKIRIWFQRFAYPWKTLPCLDWPDA